MSDEGLLGAILRAAGTLRLTEHGREWSSVERAAYEEARGRSFTEAREAALLVRLKIVAEAVEAHLRTQRGDPVWTFEMTVTPDDQQIEDDGQARIIELGDDDREEGLFVRLQSWDIAGLHADMTAMEGHRVRVTVEVLDDEG